MHAREDMTGFQTNHSQKKEGDLEGDVGTVRVKQRPTLSHLAVRVQAKSPTSQSCLEVMTLNLPALLRYDPMVRRTHVLIGKSRRK